MAVIYYPQFRVEASKAPGGSGSAQSHLDLGGRIETGTRGDLITLWCIEVSSKDWPCGSQSPLWSSLHLNPGQVSFQSVLLSQVVPSERVRDRAAHTVAARISMPEGTHSRNEATGLTSVSLSFRTLVLPFLLQVEKLTCKFFVPHMPK